MQIQNKQITLLEHHSLFVSENGNYIRRDGHVGLPQKVFSELEEFVLRNGDEACRFLQPSFMKSFGKTLKAQQFVGVIETQSRVVVEILPKIAGAHTKECRTTFLKMLRQLRHSPFSHFDTAHLRCDKMHLLEIFISMFCEELALLLQRGIRSDYITLEENASFLKGKLKFTDHIRKNSVHKERFFIEHDEYRPDRIENRIIRTAIEFLYKKSSSDLNKKRLREYLFAFDTIEPVRDVKTTFEKVKLDRQMHDYFQVLKLCRLFLNNESFTSFKGSSVAFALLFDMNRVFEDYVAHCLKRAYPRRNITAQVATEHLIEAPRREFLLRPDLRIGETIIADTKWKLLDKSKPHMGISQGDMYQMFAYGKKYAGTEEIWLIYPATECFSDSKSYIHSFGDQLGLNVLLFDCRSGRSWGVDECLSNQLEKENMSAKVLKKREEVG